MILFIALALFAGALCGLVAAATLEVVRSHARAWAWGTRIDQVEPNRAIAFCACGQDFLANGCGQVTYQQSSESWISAIRYTCMRCGRPVPAGLGAAVAARTSVTGAVKGPDPLQWPR